MAFKKRGSKDLEKAQTRATGLASIDPALDLGDGMTLAAYTALITEMRGQLEKYNIALANIDEIGNTVDALEKRLADYSERMLAGITLKYGKDSSQYEKAGGIRKSERKRPVRKPKTTP
ncbi:hypothetical protein [Anthocerotibacter panamensis]|uniref:hypothetical protein n=1 Tax=Anthocerotibacter panamensis TaxID=2857077 RepID=UPI001C4052D7|nr:hypothetical protein [Anthocerotibacter panamensis]